MKHLGDITKINGAEIPVVDCITGGSPCQDLSVAGKRAGLDGERSGLFMEQIRIVKEMRAKEIANGRTGQFIRPRYMVWENVPGAFSSNNGKDFQAVLTEIVRIAKKDAPDVPLPDGGKWAKAGAIMGIGDNGIPFSLSYRVHDAQFWGVPQRRKRIALVADFGGLSAPEVLFERKGLSGDSEPCGTERKGTAEAVGNGIEGASAFGETGIGYWQNGVQSLRATGGFNPGNAANVVVESAGVGVDVYNHTISGDVAVTLNASSCNSSTHSGPSVLQSASVGVDVYNQEITGEVAASLTAAVGGTNTSGAKVLQGETISFQERAEKPGGGKGILIQHEHVGALSTLNNQSVLQSAVYDARGNGNGEIAPTMTGDHQNRVTDYTAVCVGNGQADQLKISEKVGALNCMHDQQAVMVGSLCARDYKGVGNQYVDEGKVIPQNSTVRRLTPLECERLQGFPDGWTDIGEWTDTKGKKHQTADSARYKALGNSIALPFWFYLLRRISAQYERPATLGSLFDGIGGFPLAWETYNGKGSAVWASEIEEFPIAVTKRHFKEDT